METKDDEDNMTEITKENTEIIEKQKEPQIR